MLRSLSQLLEFEELTGFGGDLDVLYELKSDKLRMIPKFHGLNSSKTKDIS